MSTERERLSSKGRKENLGEDGTLGKRAFTDRGGTASGSEDASLDGRSERVLYRRREFRVDLPAKVVHAGSGQNRTKVSFDHCGVCAQHFKRIAASKNTPRSARRPQRSGGPTLLDVPTQERSKREGAAGESAGESQRYPVGAVIVARVGADEDRSARIDQVGSDPGVV